MSTKTIERLSLDEFEYLLSRGFGIYSLVHMPAILQEIVQDRIRSLLAYIAKTPDRTIVHELFWSLVYQLEVASRFGIGGGDCPEAKKRDMLTKLVPVAQFLDGDTTQHHLETLARHYYPRNEGGQAAFMEKYG